MVYLIVVALSPASSAAMRLASRLAALPARALAATSIPIARCIAYDLIPDHFAASLRIMRLRSSIGILITRLYRSADAAYGVGFAILVSKFRLPQRQYYYLNV